MIDKIFKAYDVRATYPVPLNEEMAWKVGHATAQYLKRSRQAVAAEQRVGMEDTVIIGRDMRPSSPELARALSDRNSLGWPQCHRHRHDRHVDDLLRDQSF